MATHTIISKRTAPFTYTKWVNINGQYHQDGPGIIINGGAGVVGGAELLSGRPLEQRTTLIPESVLTFVDDEALEKLMTIGKFRKDLERGIVTVVKGKKISQEKGDEISRRDMLPDEHNPARPITQDELEATGATIAKDGSVNISEVSDDSSPLKIRRQEAGLPGYEKKRRAESRERSAVEKRRSKR